MKFAANEPGGTSVKTPVAAGGVSPSPYLLANRNTAICARVTELFGQKFPPPHPALTPLRATRTMKLWNGFDGGTSRKSDTTNVVAALGVPDAGNSTTDSSMRVPAP